MVTAPRSSFADRLELARRLIARRTQPPVHITDQIDATGKDAWVLHDRIGAALPILEPDRNWRQRIEPDPSDDVRAYILAAVISCETMCVHLRRGGPRPVFVQLPLRRIDCGRCVGTIRRPPPENADQCDICNRHGVVMFHPFALRMGPTLVLGDSCPNCAAILGILQEASA